MITMKRPHTVTEVAGKFNRTTSRIRQICRAHGIGMLIENAVRILSDEDVLSIKKVIESDGRKKR